MCTFLCALLIHVQYIVLAAVTLESCFAVAPVSSPALRVAPRSTLIPLRGGGEGEGKKPADGGEKKGGEKKV